MKDTPLVMDAADSADADSAVMDFSPAEAAGQTLSAEPVTICRGEHCISRRDIDPDALKVLYRLSRNNYTAYLVGGGVRDLLLGRKPKDFDVSTNARPEQIRALFRNCILIGRRFRLAHVRYGEKIIETSTFRGTPKLPANPDDPGADLFQRDDNMFGSPAEDAFRRDFTVNGLFYDIESFSIIDFVGGMEDLAARRIRCIGDPNIRFREDPVRMVRAVRFASRLGFSLDPETEEAVRRHGEELTKASPARLLEEITRLFAFSSGEKAVRLLHSTGLLRVILPEVSAFLDAGEKNGDADAAGVFWRRLRALDTGDTVLPEGSPSLIFAVLFLDALKANLCKDWSFGAAPKLRFDRVHAFLDPLSVRLRFPRKLVDRIVHMYINQNRFAPQPERGKKGSLTNFVTQESFHESLALAEIVLTSEGGDQTRLNLWRDLLAERIFGREDEERHGGRGERGRHGGGASDFSAPLALVDAHGFSNGAAAGAENGVAMNGEAGFRNGGADGEDRNGADAYRDDGGEDGLPGHKLSRSARRRRNKRLRRQHDHSGEAFPSAPSAAVVPVNAPAPARPATRGVVLAASAETPEPSAGKNKPKNKPGGKTENSADKPDAKSRRGRGGKKSSSAHPAQTAPAAPSSVPSPAPAVPAEPPKPLTAAAFWAEPEPEPKPKKKPEKKSEKKPRGVKKKADKQSASSAAALERQPLPMDKADAADIPLSWLDEI